MQKQVVVLSVITLTLISVLTGLGYFFIENKINPPKKLAVTEQAKSTNQADQGGAVQSSSPSFQVQGAQTSAGQTNKLPEPAQFSVYEQYASSETARFIDIVTGNGETVGVGDTVAVVYNGYLTNGQLFDQSKTNEENLLEPFVFTIGAGTVIQGWDEGIVGMKTNGQRRLIIPSQLAYGTQGTGDGAIPPNSMLIFDVQLVQVQKQ